MPAKRKLLPRPCPKCGLEYGTIELVLTGSYHSPVICRIGHYSKSLYTYSKIVKKHVDSKKQWIKQRAWCSFRLNDGYSIHHHERHWEIRQFKNDYEKLMSRYRLKMLRIKPPEWFLREVQKDGWLEIPSKRLQKNIDYWNDHLSPFLAKLKSVKRPSKVPSFCS
ncbi:MAG: hypothetical protein ACREAE_03180 [Nitrosopumilaceae archaeon]